MWITPKINWTVNDYYNAADLNRVENNTVEVANLIQQLIGVDVELETTVLDRDYSTIEFADSLNRVERNLERLSVLELSGMQGLKTTWQAGDSFNYNDAIRLENNTAILYGVLNKNVNNVPYCGTLNCGEGGII